MTHQNKHVREAIKYALAHGWRLEPSGRTGHVKATRKCPRGARDGCTYRVEGTPRNPEYHARKLIQKVDACTH